VHGAPVGLQFALVDLQQARGAQHQGLGQGGQGGPDSCLPGVEVQGFQGPDAQDQKVGEETVPQIQWQDDFSGAALVGLERVGVACISALFGSPRPRTALRIVGLADQVGEPALRTELEAPALQPLVHTDQVPATVDGGQTPSVGLLAPVLGLLAQRNLQACATGRTRVLTRAARVQGRLLVDVRGEALRAHEGLDVDSPPTDGAGIQGLVDLSHGGEATASPVPALLAGQEQLLALQGVGGRGLEG